MTVIIFGLSQPELLHIQSVLFWCNNSTTSAASKKKDKKGNKFSAWFKDENKFRYDIECKWLRTEERVIRISEGRCPPFPTTTQPPPSTTKRSLLPPWLRRRMKKKKKKKPLLSIRTKQTLMSVFSLGKNHKYRIITRKRLSTLLPRLTSSFRDFGRGKSGAESR
ncbi:hypothetical protein OSTOST_07966 [Ostertagia ostertagi]